MIKYLSILGSTGSIGKNVLEVVKQYPGRFRVIGLSAGKNITLLKDQILAFQPIIVSVAEPDDAKKLQAMLGAEWHNKIVSGMKGAEEVAALPGADMVISAIVGAAGLTPTISAILAGKDIALANKETLVMAGQLIMDAVNHGKISLLPVDSEHNAIFQVLSAGRKEDVKKIILTASGGPFLNKSERELWDVTPEDALNHPNWNMGRKISIDSATLMNKGLEVIEAKWLFNIPLENIEVLVHPQSVVHSMVEYIDGSIISQMGIADMQIPIAYALTYPERIKLDLPALQLTNHKLSFQAPDFNKFPALKLAYQACKRGGIMPAVLNAANEVAVEAFLNRRIRFPEIALCVAETMQRTVNIDSPDLTVIIDADLSARIQAESIIEAFMMNFQQRRGLEIPAPAILSHPLT
jgi:1-deoxy-D-xylulose-5-phosphate reductoisomerase